MTPEEVYQSHKAGEALEYHLMGVEQNEGLLPPPEPGWYSCLVSEMYPNGDIEISFTNPDYDYVGVTVLKRNIPIAFRRKDKP